MSEAPYLPAEPPADGDQTSQVPPHGVAPRFSASASVPVPPASPAGAGGPANPFGPGQQYGQPGLLGPDGPLGPPPAGSAPTGGPVRAAASASVPAPATQPNPPPYGSSQPPGYPAQLGGTYGSLAAQQYGAPAPQAQFGQPPSGPAQFGQPPAPQAQFGQPPSGPGSFGQPAPYGQQPAGQGGAPAPSSPPAGSSGYAGAGYDRQAPIGQQMGQAAYSAPVYGQSPDQGRPRETAGQAPMGGWAESEQEVAPRKSKRGLIISFIVVVILIVVGVGGFVGWSLTNRASDFTVGACVKQDGNDAVVTDCAGAGVYKITSIADAENGCPDTNQPSLVLTARVGGGKKWACLAPAS